MDSVHTLGLMDRNILGIGLKIKCMEKANFYGPMETDMKESIRRIKKMVLGSFTLLMGKFTKDHGILANNMGKEYL